MDNIIDFIDDDPNVLVLTTDPSILENVIASLHNQSVPYSEVCSFSRLIRSVMNNEVIDNCQEIWSKIVSCWTQYVLCDRERMWLIKANVIGGLIEITPVKECYLIFGMYVVDDKYLICV